MADLKRRIGVKGKYSAVHRGQGNASPLANSAAAKSLRPETTDKKRRKDLPSSTRPRKNTVHSPISGLDEPAPGSEIAPSDDGEQNTPIPEEVRPEFLDGVAGVETEQPNNALDADIQRDANSLDDVSKAEASADKNDGQSSAESANELDLRGASPEEEEDDDGSLYNNRGSKKQNLRGKITSTRGRITLAIATTLFGVTAGLATILPAATVTLFSDLMSKVGEVQVDNQFRYHRRWNHRVRDLFSAEGRRGTKLITDMERRGYRFRYDASGRNISGIAKPNSNIFVTSQDEMGEAIATHMNDRIPLYRGRWKDKTATALQNKFGIKKNSIVSLTSDPDKSPKQLINKELREAGANQEIRVSSRANIDTDADDATQSAQQEAHENSKDLVDRQGEFADIAEQLDEGVDLNELDADPLKVDSFVEGGVPGDASINYARTLDSSTGVVSKGIGLARSIAGGTDFLARICTINRAIAAGMIVAREVRAYNMYLSAFRFITASDGIKKGDAQADLVREIGKRITSPDALGTYVGASAGLSTVLNGGFNKAKNDENSSTYSVSGEIRGWELTAFQNSNVFGTCDLWLNGWTQVGTMLADVGLTIFSAGGWRAGRQAAEAGAREAFETGFKASIRRAIQSRTGKSVRNSLVTESSFSTLTILLKLRVEKMMAGEITGQERGGSFANIMFGGIGVGSRQRSLRAGQVPTRAAEYLTVHQQFLAEKKAQMANKSIFSRYLDTSNLDSLAFKTKTLAILGANNPFSNIKVDSIYRAPQDIASSFIGLFGGKGSAQSPNPEIVAFDTYAFQNGNYKGQEIAVDFAGNVLTTMPERIARIDPEENIPVLVEGGHIDSQTLEPISDEFLGHIEECVDAMDVISVLEQDSGEWLGNENPTQDCFAELPITERFKAHLAFLDASGISDAHLSPEEIDTINQQTTTQTNTGNIVTTPINAEGLNGYVIPCEGAPRQVIRVGADSANWQGIPDSGSIGLDSAGDPIKVYIRDACAGISGIKTVLIVGSIHGSENGGQLVAHEMLFNEDIPDNVRIVAIPEYCSCAGTGSRGNVNGVDLNRNNAYLWESLPASQRFETGLTWLKGSAPASEPETQAMNRFLLSLGRADVALFYHDSLSYVAPVGSTNALLARQYGDAASLPVGNENGPVVTQRGSIDAWYNQQTGTPAILVEMQASLPDSVIRNHISGLQAIMRGGVL